MVLLYTTEWSTQARYRWDWKVHSTETQADGHIYQPIISRPEKTYGQGTYSLVILNYTFCFILHTNYIKSKTILVKMFP